MKPTGRRGGLILPALLLIGIVPVFGAGCATQADVMDMQMAFERRQAGEEDLQKRLRVIESYFKERSTTVQRGQADLIIKLDELAVDLQAAQGSLEENRHLLVGLSERMDDQTFRSRDLTGRLDVLDIRVFSLGKSVNALNKAVTAVQKSGSLPSDLELSYISIEKPAENTARAMEKRIVLPGRPTEPDQTTGVSPSEAYGLAYNDYLKGNYDLALLGFRNFLANYESTSLAPNAQYWIGESLYGKKKYVKAIEAFDKVVSDYPGSIKVSGALLKSGYAFAELGDKPQARLYLKKVLENYPLSNEGKLAKKKLAELT